MNKDRIKEILSNAGERYRLLLSSICDIPHYTLDNLPLEKTGEFVHGCLYEFTEYRKEFGGRLVFMCIRGADRKPFFLERFRIYGKESPQGIERADDPTYMNGIGGSLYLRVPDGSSILDIGCGTGKYLKLLKGKNLATLAMDMSGELLDEDRRDDDLKGIHFFPGDCIDLRFLKDREIDYLTGVNILNVLYPEMLGSLLEQGARTAKGGLFAFTLPARADLWTEYPPEAEEILKEALNKGSEEYLEIASNQTFSGQMRLFSLVADICRKKGWTLRIFRFLDKMVLEERDFLKSSDSKYLKPGEDSILKLLEFPVRRAAHTGIPQAGSYLVCSIGYGMEVYFGNETLSPAAGVHYFDNDTDFEKLDIRSEINGSISQWELPF